MKLGVLNNIIVKEYIQLSTTDSSENFFVEQPDNR